MYSCVVKTCKNISVDVAKETGAKFYTFPTDISWRYKWIQVVRACRYEELWLPTKFSVVCSAHFEEGDTYTTPDGNRHITQNAIPKLKLFDNEPKIGPDDSEVLIGDQVESTSDQIKSAIIKLEPTETTVSSAEIESQAGGQSHDISIKVEPQKTTAEPSPIASMCPIAPQQDPEVDEGLVDHPCLYKFEINKKNEHLLTYRKKIKILHDKVRRYENRNRKLKSIFKEIRTKKLIDKHVFRRLTAGLKIKKVYK